MSVDLKEAVEEVIERRRSESDEATARLNTTLSLLVALSATFMALCNVKDGNVVQAMSQAQGNTINAWNYYQAKSVKQHLTEASIDEMTFQRQIASLADYVRARYTSQPKWTDVKQQISQARQEGM